jgi:hypothetical protein
MKVILISGKAQHGKDTVAKMIFNRLRKDDHKVLMVHYADLLKFICANYFGWNGIKDEKGRELLQYVGTDVVREKNPWLWVDFVSTMLLYFDGNWDYVIIPDCRFPNEVSKMSERFDTTYIRVERPNYDSGLTPEQLAHPSETALDNYEPDYRIINDSDKSELLAKVSLWIKEKLYGDE